MSDTARRRQYPERIPFGPTSEDCVPLNQNRTLMARAGNPFGLNDVTPYLIIPEIEKLIPFLKEVFGARIRADIKYREDGSVMHTEITIGDSVIMMGEPMADFPAMPSTLYVYVDDCDKVFKKAVELGGTPVAEPQDFPHGDRYGGVRDNSGNIWWIVTHIKSN